MMKWLKNIAKCALRVIPEVIGFVIGLAIWLFISLFAWALWLAPPAAVIYLLYILVR